jgi:hypothetical protein
MEFIKIRTLQNLTFKIEYQLSIDKSLNSIKDVFGVKNY